MKTRVCKNMSKKDLVNAKNASKSVPSAIDAGLVFEITGVAIVENGATGRNGQPCDVGYIATKTDGVFGFISDILISALDDIADIMTDNEGEENPEPITARFIAGTSKNGTEYYSIELL